jgi:hypothetical protein
MEVFTLGFIALMALNVWVLVGVAVAMIMLMIFANDDEVGSETLLFILMVVGIGYLVWGSVSIGAAILGVVYYSVAGAVWSIFNYARIVRKRMKSDKELRIVKSLRFYQKLIHKNRIVRWIAYWPFSIVNYLIADFIVAIFRHIADWLQNTYKNITTHFYKKFFGEDAVVDDDN